MKLSQRLQAIYNLVNSPCILADIGTDHGQLPIALVLDGKVEKAYACDVAQGPLSRAAQAIEKANVQSQIETRLQDGLASLPREVDSIVIAGMGSDTIINILSNDLEYALNTKQLILQSNSHVDLLRTWLNEHGFMILHEELVYEQNHYYQILNITKGQQQLSREQILFGYDLYKHPLFDEWIDHKISYFVHILDKLPKTHQDHDHLSDYVDLLQKALKKDCFHSL